MVAHHKSKFYVFHLDGDNKRDFVDTCAGAHAQLEMCMLDTILTVLTLSSSQLQLCTRCNTMVDVRVRLGT